MNTSLQIQPQSRPVRWWWIGIIVFPVFVAAVFRDLDLAGERRVRLTLCFLIAYVCIGAIEAIAAPR